MSVLALDIPMWLHLRPDNLRHFSHSLALQDQESQKATQATNYSKPDIAKWSESMDVYSRFELV